MFFMFTNDLLATDLKCVIFLPIILFYRKVIVPKTISRRACSYVFFVNNVILITVILTYVLLI